MNRKGLKQETKGTQEQYVILKLLHQWADDRGMTRNRHQSLEQSTSLNADQDQRVDFQLGTSQN